MGRPPGRTTGRPADRPICQRFDRTRPAPSRALTPILEGTARASKRASARKPQRWQQLPRRTARGRLRRHRLDRRSRATSARASRCREIGIPRNDGGRDVAARRTSPSTMRTSSRTRSRHRPSTDVRERRWPLASWPSGVGEHFDRTQAIVPTPAGGLQIAPSGASTPPSAGDPLIGADRLDAQRRRHLDARRPTDSRPGDGASVWTGVCSAAGVPILRRATAPGASASS